MRDDDGAGQPRDRDGEPSRVRRLVCVALNAAIDKIGAVDHLVPGEIHRPELVSAVAGGKAINVARAASAMGVPVVVVPVVGGHSGAWIVDDLDAAGLPARPVVVPGESRTCLSVLDRSTGALTEFYEAGLALDAAGLESVEAAVAAETAQDPHGCVVVVSGSLPRGAPDDLVARLVAIAHAAGARCAVDAAGALLARAVRARPWLAKINADEAAAATGLAADGERGAVASARQLRDAGAARVVVTRGVDGAVALDEDGVAWRIGPAPERGPYPVGSGDSMLAGLLAALAGGASLAEAARHGAAVGTANALRPGQGDVDPRDVDRLLPAISLDRLGGVAG